MGSIATAAIQNPAIQVRRPRWIVSSSDGTRETTKPPRKKRLYQMKFAQSSNRFCSPGQRARRPTWTSANGTIAASTTPGARAVRRVERGNRATSGRYTMVNVNR